MGIFGWTCLGLLLLVVLFVAGCYLYDQYRRITNGWPWAWLRTLLGWGSGVNELARRLDLTVEELFGIEPAYQERLVPKKRGGNRRLLIPSDALKAIQRRMLRRLLQRLRAHPAALGFEVGKSIVHNAAAHVGQRIVIKLDVVEFFPSIKAERIEHYFRRIGWSREAAALLTRLTTHDDGLPQGAPTSPRLSNLVNYVLDARLDKFVRRRKGKYTRYADDITISFPKDYPRRVRGTIQYVRRLAKAFGLTIHTRGKLRIVRRYQQQRVTGLVVNDKVQLPRTTRRLLRAIAHHLRSGRPATHTIKQLAGWQALQQMIVKQTRHQSVDATQR